MKLININKIASLEVPNDYTWSLGEEAVSLIVKDRHGQQILELKLLLTDVEGFVDNDERCKWCHDWLVEYLREEIGPPYQSNLDKVEGETWVGWQAITALEDGLFRGTRCILGKGEGSGLRLSFSIKRDQTNPVLLEILESISFQPGGPTSGG